MGSSAKGILGFYKEAKTINNIHSPFAYDLITSLFDFSSHPSEAKIEAYRKLLLKNKDQLKFEDYGAGSPSGSASSNKSKSVRAIVRASASNVYKCRLLRNLTHHFKPRVLLELGTNLGIGTAYLYSGYPDAELHTVEGAESILMQARGLFSKLNIPVHTHLALFDDFLEGNSELVSQVNMVYMDGNHSYEATLRYFKTLTESRTDDLVLIVDDINWSEGMSQAWAEMKTYPNCMSVDIYKMGLLVIKDSFVNQQHFKVLPRIFKPWQLGFFG